MNKACGIGEAAVRWNHTRKLQFRIWDGSHKAELLIFAPRK